MKQGFRGAVALGALLALAGCQAPPGAQAGQTAAMELKIYGVPPAQSGRLAEALGNALGGKATVTMPAPGKLLVYAPRDTQSSIGAALADLGRAEPARAAVAQVGLHFWVVDAEAGAGADDPTLHPLAATLDALRQRMGPLHFQVNQVVAAVVASNHQGAIATTAPGGYPRRFGYQVTGATADGIDLTLDYQDDGRGGLRQLNTEVGVRYGDYLVLAQAPGACSVAMTNGLPAPCANAPTLRLLIVQVDRLNPQA